MGASNFKRCLNLVLGHEGGWSSHPKDPGGDTMRGVTQATYDRYRRSHGLKLRTVRLITDSELQDVYRSGYWSKVSGDRLPSGIDYSTFDAGVNSGPSRGVRWLQKALGVRRDGACGPKTQAAAKDSDHRKTIVKACAARMGFLEGLRTWSVFGRGWSRRVSEVEAAAVAMVLTKELPKASVPAEMKAESSKAQSASKAQKAGSAASGTSGGATATLADWDWSSMLPWLVGGCVVLAVVALFLLHRSRVNAARAEAYAQAAKEMSQ